MLLEFSSGVVSGSGIFSKEGGFFGVGVAEKFSLLLKMLSDSRGDFFSFSFFRFALFRERIRWKLVGRRFGTRYSRSRSWVGDDRERTGAGSVRFFSVLV